MNKNRYKVYQDPIEKNDFEGNCIILEILRQDIGTYDGNKFILADVRFDDGFETVRTIDLKDKIKS